MKKYSKCASAWVSDEIYSNMCIKAQEKNQKISEMLREILAGMFKDIDEAVKTDIIPEEVNCA